MNSRIIITWKMSSRGSFPFFVALVLLLPIVAYSLEQIHLTDLREFTVQGVGARILTSKGVIEDLMNNISTGFDSRMPVLEPANDDKFYDTLRFGEVFVAYSSLVHDHTLSNLSCNIKERVAISYYLVTIWLPFVTNGQHGIISLVQFTDSNKKVFFPYNTNSENIIYINEIKETKDGKITLRRGNDVMVMKTQQNVACHGNQRDVGKDFDKISGKSFTTTNYPLEFDWGCDVFGDEVDFCSVLKQNENDLKGAGANVCTEMTITSQSKRCPTTLEIQEMTGFFRNVLPFLSVPVESFEAEWVVRDHGAGIIFPCFTNT